MTPRRTATGRFGIARTIAPTPGKALPQARSFDPGEDRNDSRLRAQERA